MKNTIKAAVCAATAAVLVSCVSVTGTVPEEFNREISVFGVTIWATESVTHTRLLHAGNVLAQYLDNDEDGEPDNTAVTNELAARHATILMFADEAEANSFDYDKLPDNITAVQELYDSETNPGFNPDQTNEYFDASLEKVLNLITAHGYANAFPGTFGQYQGTELATAMDTARGGYFPTIPEEYPATAWFTCYDPACDYQCQITGYIYWALTSSLGAQDYPGRYQEIKDVWQLNTKELLNATDTGITEIISNTGYKLPTNLPDGSYTGFTITITDLDCST